MCLLVKLWSASIYIYQVVYSKVKTVIDNYHTEGCCRLIARLTMASNPCLARLAASFLLPASSNVNTNTTKTQKIQTQHQTHKMKTTTFPLKMGPLSHSASSTSSGHVHHVDLFGTMNILLKREESVETVLKPT